MNTLLKQKALAWATLQSHTLLWLDSNDYPDRYSQFDAILALSPYDQLLQEQPKGAFEALQRFLDSSQAFYQHLPPTLPAVFGYLSYDLKNDIFPLSSSNIDELGFPAMYFFRPLKILLFKDDEVQCYYHPLVANERDRDIEAIHTFSLAEEKHTLPLSVDSRLSKEEYIQKVRQMQAHIQRGDIYEANFCQEFYANGSIDPLYTYYRLNALSEAPFACFMKINDKYVIGASPERFLQKIGRRLLSQPIKGTAKRAEDPEEDLRIKESLVANPKERSENIMITDLVRNDLSHYAQKGSVEVRELCAPYTFKQVHQLITSITAELKEGVRAIESLRTTFPMGSMTGAPKLSAMQFIEQLESTRRSVYSGAIGYFTPAEDFDFNVVIRSIFYNETRQYLSFSVGSAITAIASAEAEYEECLLKGKALIKAINPSV